MGPTKAAIRKRKAAIRKRKADLLDKWREGRVAGERDGIRFACQVLFGGHDEDAVCAIRDQLCDLLWFGKGWNAARAEGEERMPLYGLNTMVNNISSLLRQLPKD